MRGWSCSTPATPPIAAPSIRTRAKVVSARRDGDHWAIGVEDTLQRRGRRGEGAAGRQRGRAVGRPRAVRRGRPERRRTRSGWSRAATSSCAKKFDDPRAYFFQNKDGRIIFAIPYEDDFTLIGTTDQDYDGDPGESRDQRQPRSTISATRRASISPSRCAARTSSGPIPACARSTTTAPRKAQEATRDYVLKVDGAAAARRSSTSSAARSPPTGGWPSRCWRRSRACSAPRASRGRRTASLPGGDFAATGFDAEVDRLKGAYAFLDLRLARRLVRLYGTQGARAARPRQVGGRSRPALRRRSLRGEVRYLMAARMGA